MKHFLSFSIAMAIVATITQIHAQQVVATGGGTFENENLSLSFTIGEPVTETFSGTDFILTQGFQQPYSFYLQQILNIPAGWSGVSTYLDPLNKNVDGLFSPVVNDLIILASMNGFYYPAQSVNTLGNWDYLSGYQLKAENSFELTVTGSKIPAQELAITEGWNLIPVLSSCDAAVEDLFSGFPGLQIVKEVAGTKIYWPAYNINTLENLLPGKAYFVASADAGSITFPECTKSSPKTMPQQKPKNLTPWNDLSYPAATHVVAFPVAVLENSGIQPGDVIGAFTMDGICAGRLEIHSDQVNAAMTIFGNDLLTPETDGFQNAEPIHLKVYRPVSDEVFDLEVDFDPTLPNTGYFAIHGISAISSLKLQATGIAEISNISMEVYPNPSNGIFNIRINKTLENPEIIITDFRGSLVNIAQPIIIENGLPLKIDLTGLPRGVYFLNIKDDGFVAQEKIIIQ